jgi:ketosteroid isomerase-like protein
MTHNSEPVLLATPEAEPNLALVRSFLMAMESAAEPATIDAFFTEDAVAVEVPSGITNTTARHDLRSMQLAGERGRQACEKQHYELHTAMAMGNLVAVELTWTATMGIALGHTPAGGEIRAHFGAFYECRDGKIAAIRNYDGFEPL